MNLLQVVHLGTLDYATALRLQQTLVQLRKDGRIADTLLLLEHPPVVTLGRNAHENNVLASREQLKARGVELHETDRGGDVTFHGPGQLVGYPIVDLRGLPPRTDPESGEPRRIGPVEYVRRLEESLIRACADFGIPAHREIGMTGVWTGGPEPRKIAAIGVHISRGVTSHGFALNVHTYLEYFDLIIPCGLEGKPVTSMERELAGAPSPRPLDLDTVSHAVTRQFGNVFGVQILWLESLESLLNAVPEPAAPQDTPLLEPDDLRSLREELEQSPRDDVSWA